MERRIIHIDEEKCNGCGACAKACHEGAIAMENGKAKLIRDDYCDGLGDCLPNCPTGAITFTVREAAPYDEAAVLARKIAGLRTGKPKPGAGCPGMASRQLAQSDAPAVPGSAPAMPSRLAQWPVQIKLAPVCAPYFDGASLLIAADCSAYSYSNFHEQFMRGRTTLIGCPKLDSVDYSEKLCEILRQNEVRDVTVVRMEVPCCGGLENAVRTALKNCGKDVPCQVVTLSLDGRILP